MKTRTILLLLLAGAALVGTSLLGGGDGEPARRSTAPPATEAVAEPESPTVASTSASPPTVVADDHPDHGTEEVQAYWEGLDDPARSDLPPAQFRELSALGAKVQRAYLTSEGREEFPGYFGRDPVPPLFSGVVIYTAGARSSDGRPDLVEVTVVWSGQPVGGGAFVDHHMTVVLLERGPEGWQPQAQLD